MEIEEIKIEVKDLGRETIIDNQVFDTVVVKNYWDAHGKKIPWEDDTGKTSHTYKNVKVCLEKITRCYWGKTTFDELELTINGEKYLGEITSCRGSQKKLNIQACIGAG